MANNPNKKAMARKMKSGIHRIGDNPSRFVHKGKPGDVDLYETWKGGNQKITPTTKSMGGNRGEKYALRKSLEKYLDNFIKHGEKRSDENIWKYARLNPDSDKRIF